MILHTPFGPAWASINDDGAVTGFGFGANSSAIGYNAEVERQVSEYFEGFRHSFVLPLAPKGTSFQNQVWSELQSIPFGTTITYTELGQRVGIAKAPRAAGRANATNPISVIIPCHRVVGAKGALTGYAFGVELKRNLLDFERRVKAATTARTRAASPEAF